MTRTWAGVDVGGSRKGFDAVVVVGSRFEAHRRNGDPADVASWLAGYQPTIVAVDSPRTPAEDGRLSRQCERDFARAGICGIRFTPDRSTMTARVGGYYQWIENGFALYDELVSLGLEVIECFPTASWTRWAGARAPRRRSAWTRAALGGLDVSGIPGRTNQDLRDAIAAAVTARQHHEGRTESFGDLVVPVQRQVFDPFGGAAAG
jgi:predicted nuclease with RNAse H fold